MTPQVENGLHGLNYSSVCSGLGGLNNQFSWTYLRTGVELVTMPTLDLLNVDILQAGQYQCTVSNQAGNDSAIYTLNSKHYEGCVIKGCGLLKLHVLTMQ